MASFEEKKKKALLKAEKRKEKEELREIDQQHRPHIQTSKKLMMFILVNCSVVEIYSMWLMVHLANLDPLTTLMGSVITESISFAIYCVKSFKETKEEALIQLDRDKFEAGLENNPREDECLIEETEETIDTDDYDYNNEEVYDDRSDQ